MRSRWRCPRRDAKCSTTRLSWAQCGGCFQPRVTIGELPPDLHHGTVRDIASRPCPRGRDYGRGSRRGVRREARFARIAGNTPRLVHSGWTARLPHRCPRHIVRRFGRVRPATVLVRSRPTRCYSILRVSPEHVYVALIRATRGLIVFSRGRWLGRRVICVGY